MKVIQLCGKDFFGAGRAAYRLHQGLQKAGVESVMWVGAKRSNDATVVDIRASYFKKKMSKVFVRLEKLFVKKYGGNAREMFSVGSFGHAIKKRIEKEKPDIIHLHWINRGFLDFRELRDFKIPVVISLHDMWWYTGGCHYDEGCGKYVHTCGKCPVLQSDKHMGLSYNHLIQKKDILDSLSKVAFVGLSSWMANCAKRSTIGQIHKVVQISNGIDIEKFKAVDRKNARVKLGLPLNKFLLLFAAVDVLSESRKGYQYISKALTHLNQEYEVIVVGEKGKEEIIGGLKAHYIGEISDDQLLIDYMSAVDVSVVPSLQENLSNLIMESLSCSTPVVAFNIGGNGDMIKHRENGYLALEKNVEDLAEGIRYCCNTDHNEVLRLNARKKVVDEFNINQVAKKYIGLYQLMMNKTTND
ncbi:glycosyltransferase [Labilibacter sediminis]|nr:glycosyltransferase [Labilibacter sediminis]